MGFMSNKSKFTLAAALALSAFSAPTSAQNAEKEYEFVKKQEKCYGIAKAGKNDCASETHSCATYSKIDGGRNEWVMMPTGICERIIGAYLEPEAIEEDS